MKLQDVFHNPTKLHKLGAIAVWVQAALGGILLAQTWESITHIIGACLLAATLLCVHKGGNRRAARVTARVITGLFWLIAVIFIAQLVLAVLYSWDYYAPDLLANICYFCGMFLCYFSPAALNTMLYNNEHTTAYDRVTGIACQTAVLPVAYLCLFAETDVAWTVSRMFFPYLWGVTAVIATGLVWLCAKHPTVVQTNALRDRRDARRAKIAARKNK